MNKYTKDSIKRLECSYRKLDKFIQWVSDSGPFPDRDKSNELRTRVYTAIEDLKRRIKEGETVI